MKGSRYSVSTWRRMFSNYTGRRDRKGRPVAGTSWLRRDQLLRVLGELEPCLIGIEASTGAFYWQRQFEKLGHAVKIMAPQYVKPFVRRQKNDTNDAEAICTAGPAAEHALRAEEDSAAARHPGPPPRAPAPRSIIEQR